MTTATLNLGTSDQHFLLEGMDWIAYGEMLRTLGDRHVFLTYDRGRMELMSPSYEHENRSELINRMIWAICDGLSRPAKGGGSTTFRREDLHRGLEPDKCFWVENESTVRSKRNIDLSIDPPPDLCVEIEISNRLLDRVGIYAALGVPELWRDDGRTLRIYRLSVNAEYVQIPASISFPLMTASRLNRYLAGVAKTDEMTWARKVRLATKRLKA